MEEEKPKNPLPNCWLRCPRKSSNIIANKFMVFKTPLSDKFDDQVPAQFRFPPKMLLDLCKTKKLKIGLWIDLTNTFRFYNKSEIENTTENCKYLKLQCRGYREAPTLDQTRAFVNVCHNFINQHPFEIIAVHCTHGFNRSGFMIVSYLVEKMDCGIEIALQEFSHSRNPGIYKQDYLNELYRRYDDVEDAPLVPPLPDWYIEEINLQNVDNPEPSSCLLRNNVQKTPVFMIGVTGVTVFQEQPKACYLQTKIQQMCNWKTSKGFPGSQPVSMNVQNICLLHQKPYRVSWKADGTRYMMLIDREDEIYFFDRDNNVFKVQELRFVHRKDLQKHLTNTLLDGEMVIDIVNGEKIPRFLVYDIIKYEGQDVGKMPFYPVRLKCISEEIVKPRYAAMEKGFINKLAEPFSVRNKEFWDVTQTTSLLGEKFARCLSHEPDGLIFQPSKEPYVAGRCDDALKWKPLDMNSVDFRLKIIREDGKGLVPCKTGYLYVSQLDSPFSKMKWCKSIKDLDNKIIECRFENNQWVFMRERTDKSFPNSYTTAKAVCSSIQQPITKERLLDFIEWHRFQSNTDVKAPPLKVMRK